MVEQCMQMSMDWHLNDAISFYLMHNLKNFQQIEFFYIVFQSDVLLKSPTFIWNSVRNTRIFILQTVSLHDISFQQSYNTSNVRCRCYVSWESKLGTLITFSIWIELMLIMDENQIRKIAMAIAITTNKHRHRVWIKSSERDTNQS